MKRVKRKLRLKKKVKENLLILLFVIGFAIYAVESIYYVIDKYEKIESGEMILIDHNAGDR